MMIKFTLYDRRTDTDFGKKSQTSLIQRTKQRNLGWSTNPKLLKNIQHN